MTWRDRNGPVFRMSPDSAWPLGPAIVDRNAKRQDRVDGLGPQDESDGAGTAIAKTNGNQQLPLAKKPFLLKAVQ